jgi:hypothetical protein
MQSLALSYTAMSEHCRPAIRHHNTIAQFSQSCATPFVQVCHLAGSETGQCGSQDAAGTMCVCVLFVKHYAIWDHLGAMVASCALVHLRPGCSLPSLLQSVVLTLYCNTRSVRNTPTTTVNRLSSVVWSCAAQRTLDSFIERTEQIFCLV